MYRKIIIIFILMLTLVGCNQEVIDNGDDINNGDIIDIEKNIEDNIENDEIDSSTDIEMIQIEDMDSYVESLYDDVFGYNKTDLNGGLFHEEGLVTVKDLSMRNISALAFHAAYESIDTKEGYDGRCFYYDDYASTITRLFGDSVTVTKDEWQGGGCVWVYNEEIDAFLGEPAYGGEERKLFDCRYFGKYELDGDYLYIYDRCYYCEYDNDSGLTFFYNNINKTPESLFLKWEIRANYSTYYIGDEVTQKYGAEYKHTFAKAKNGSYYWVSSEPVE